MEFEFLLKNLHNYPGVTDDSREVGSDWIFVAGAGRDKQHDYLAEALNKGASLVVTESPIDSLPASLQIQVPDRRTAAWQLASHFHDNPSAQLLVIGVTGTCGKTTSTYFVEAVLTAAGHRVGVIGTESIRYEGLTFPSPNTTPSAFVLQRTLRSMHAAGCSAVVMEVSSHAYAQQRSHGVLFDGAIFTNLSVEHLDLHGDMESYYAAKKGLFTDYASRAQEAGKTFYCAINLRDEWGKRLYSELALDGQSNSNLAGFCLDNMPDGSSLTIDSNGIRGQVDGVTIDSPLLGKFNAENILGVLHLAHLLDLPNHTIERGIRSMSGVPGRMECAYRRGNLAVIVDYAHKPGALEVVLYTLSEICQGKVISVFGCGGQRDRAKRPVMGAVSTRYAELSILTVDNSRGEDSEAIFADILSGIPFEQRKKVVVEPDRSLAIERAFRAAGPDDIILVAGRGAERQLITNTSSGGTVVVDFDDRDIVRQVAIRLYPELDLAT